MRKGEPIGGRSPCPLCRSSSALVAGTHDRRNRPLSTLLCLGCGLYRVDPLPDDGALREYYRNQYRLDYKGLLRPKPHHVMRAGRAGLDRIRWLLPHLNTAASSATGPQTRRWLDVGAGSGEFAFLLQRKGLHVTALEPNHGYAEYIRLSFELPVFSGFLEDLPHDCQPFDGISSFHMLEHHPDPVSALKLIGSHLREGGLLAVEVPNAAFELTHPLSRFHPAHLVHFTLTTLESAARAAGFVPMQLRTSSDGGVLWGVFRNTASPPPVPATASVCEQLLRAEQQRSAYRYYTNPKIWLRTFRRLLALSVERWQARSYLSPEDHLACLDLPD